MDIYCPKNLYCHLKYSKIINTLYGKMSQTSHPAGVMGHWAGGWGHVGKLCLKIRTKLFIAFKQIYYKRPHVKLT